MKKCYFCGKELPEGTNYCASCDHETLTDDLFVKPKTYQKQTVAWYLLPIMIGIIGGIIAFLMIKDKDPLKSQYCLIIGIVTTIIGIVFSWAIENNTALFRI